MRRRFLIVGLALTAIAAVLSPAARAKERAYGFCTPGQQTLSVSGLNVAPTALASFSECQVTVYIAGTTTLATIYSDNGSPPTPLANPFTAAANSYWAFYAANGRYSAQISGPNFPTFTYIDILLCDPAEGTGCGGSGSGSVVNFAAGNLPPLFTTTVTTPTTTPNLLFNLSNAPSFNFYGNFDATTGPPAFWQLIAGTNITLVPNTGTNTLTINSTGGGGTGCTLPGVDTGVLSEHPAGTCFDSLHFTWDDGASKQNLQAGDGTNTNTGSQDSFTFASGGHTNLCFLCWNFGNANNINAVSLTNDEKKMVFGWFNTNSGAGSSFQLGDTNTLNFAGASHCTGCSDDLIQIGTQNNMSSTVSTVYEAPATGVQIGDVNQATLTLAGGALTRFVQSGSANNFTETAGSSTGISLAYAYGLQNRVKDNLGTDSVFTGIYGFDNEADGIDPQDVSIFGASNTVHSLVVCTLGNCPPAQDSVVFGDQNTMTNVGSGFMASVNSTLTNCTACGVIGYNESNSISDSLNIGLGLHEITLTNGHVTLPSLASASVTNVCASTTGLLQITGCPSGGGFANPMTTVGDIIGGGTAGAPTRVPGGKTGQILMSTNSALVSFVSPGLAWGNAGAAVTTTPYAPTCDSATSVLDRDTTIVFQSGAGVINVPDPTATGCTGNMVLSFYDDGAGTLTVNRGGTATFNVLDGSTNTDGATSFTFTNGQTVTLNANAAGTVWMVKKATGGSNPLSGMTSGQVAIAGSATTITSSKALQGTDSSVLSSGTVSGTASILCTDANGGATTVGCPAGDICDTVTTTDTLVNTVATVQNFTTTCVIPANTFTASKILAVDMAFGETSVTTSQTLTIGGTIGGSSFFTQNAAIPTISAGTTADWLLRCNLGATAAPGASVPLTIGCTVVGNSNVVVRNTLETVTVATNGALTVAFTAQWGGTTGTNTASLLSLKVGSGGASGGGSISVPVNWSPDPAYGGNSADFAAIANNIEIFAIPGPQVPVSISAVSFKIAFADSVNSYSLGIYGPCALGVTCSTLVCSTTAQTFPSAVGVSLPCSQGTVTINPVTTAGQYYFLATTGPSVNASFSSANHTMSPVCTASTTTSTGGVLPASVAVPAASWTLCASAPLLLFHQ